jgi:hypothetical protein
MGIVDVRRRPARRPDRSEEAPPVRKTVTTVAAAGLLFLAACSDGGDGLEEGLADDPSSTTTSEPSEPDQSTTTAPGESDGPDDSGPDEDPGNNEVCEGQTPVWAFAPVPADRAPARAELAAYARPSAAQQQPGDECARPEPELGTGDVQITLRWESSADLDLHVTEPDGTEIYYADKGPTSTGGRLDVDSNVGCQEDGSVENVFWPSGRMPRGEYTVEVNGFRVDGCGGGRYTVVAQVQGREVLRETGSVDHRETDTYRFTAE